jgi:hypothetical protein
MKSRWRAIKFSVLGMTALSAGILSWVLSIPPHVVASEGIKQLIGIYVSNPNARISATIHVGYSHDTSRMQAFLDVERRRYSYSCDVHGKRCAWRFSQSLLEEATKPSLCL